MATAVTTFEHLLVEAEPPAARITLNRPEKRNALSLELMEELIEALKGLGAEPAIRAIVVEGAGPVFSSGHDLSEMVGRDLGFYQRLFDVCTVMMEAIHRVPQPVIAKVHGIATAAGCQLVAACDLAVAAEGTRFATPGVKTGLFCSTPMVPVSRAVGRKRALQLLLTGEPIDAETACDWGLVNLVVPAEELKAAVAQKRRDARMSALADAFVALPGGFGTLEEVSEVITQKQFGFVKGPLVAVNTAGFYDPLAAFFEGFYERAFAKPEFRATCPFVATPADAMAYIDGYRTPAPTSKWFT